MCMIEKNGSGIDDPEDIWWVAKLRDAKLEQERGEARKRSQEKETKKRMYKETKVGDLPVIVFEAIKNSLKR